MGLYKRGSVWWMSFSYQGRQIRRSTETTDKKLAQRILDKVKGEIAEGKWFEKLPGEDRTFKEMMDKYMAEHSIPKKASSERDKASILHLSPFFDEIPLVDITSTMINEYKKRRREEGASPATINRELALMKHAFNLAYKIWGWVSDNPVMKVPLEKEPPSRDRWLTYEEEEKLIAVSPEWLQEIITIAVETGCRREEILSLQWKDVDLINKVITIFGKKTGARRTIPLTTKAYEVLLKKKKTRDKIRLISGDFVFTHPPGKKVNIYTLRWAFEEATKKANIDNLRFHDLRHTFATRLAQNGVDPYTIQKLMGHTSFTTTQRYAHHFVDSLRRGIEYLDISRNEQNKNYHKFITFNDSEDKKSGEKFCNNDASY